MRTQGTEALSSGTKPPISTAMAARSIFGPISRGPMKIYRACRSAWSTLRYRIAASMLTAQYEHELSHTSAIARLEGETVVKMRELRLMREEQWLRSELRAVPYWVPGHRTLAELALASGDIATAYASAHAILICRPDDGDARYILSKAYLRQGDPESAAKLLSALVAQSQGTSQDHRYRKEYAAALLALGRLAEAAKELSELPEQLLDAESKAALMYAQRQTNIARIE